MPEGPSAFPLFFPYVALLMTGSYVDADNFAEYGSLWVALLVYGGTTVYATVTAYRCKFRNYSLDVIGSAPGAFFGCLFFWSYAFYHCIENKRLIENGEASPRSAGSPRRRGIAVAAAIWSMIWILWLPVSLSCLVPSALWDNEQVAMSMLKKYREAQTRYRSENTGAGDADAGRGSGFCSSFRALYYDKDEKGEPKALIPQKMADAFTKTVSDVPGVDMPLEDPVAYKGYYYCDDPYVTANGLWQSRFGLFAYPKRPNVSGIRVFWVGEEGRYFWCDYDDLFGRDHNNKHTGPFTEKHSPLHPEGEAPWEEF